MILRGMPDGGPTPNDGQYLKAFDHEAFDGRGNLETTTDIREARRFETMADAFDFYRRVPECKPLRSDARPNRPLTATCWEFVTVEDGFIRRGRGGGAVR